jgi:hypothetical protein
MSNRAVVSKSQEPPAPQACVKPWTCFVLHVPRYKLRAARDGLVPLLRRFPRELHFNFNTYSNPADPHVSLRVDHPPKWLRPLLDALAKALGGKVTTQEYMEDLAVRRAYEAATRLYLALLDVQEHVTPDADLLNDHALLFLFHGLWDNLHAEDAERECDFYRRLIPGVNHLIPALWAVEREAVFPRDGDTPQAVLQRAVSKLNLEE